VCTLNLFVAADVYTQTTASTTGPATEIAGNRTTDGTGEPGINNTLFLGLVIGIPVAVTAIITAIVICSVVLFSQLISPAIGIPNATTAAIPAVQARPPAALARHDRYNQAWMIGVANRPGAIGNRVYARQNPVYVPRYGNQNVGISRLSSAGGLPTPSSGYRHSPFILQRSSRY